MASANAKVSSLNTSPQATDSSFKQRCLEDQVEITFQNMSEIPNKLDENCSIHGLLNQPILKVFYLCQCNQKSELLQVELYCRYFLKKGDCCVNFTLHVLQYHLALELKRFIFSVISFFFFLGSISNNNIYFFYFSDIYYYRSVNFSKSDSQVSKFSFLLISL